MGKIAQTPGSQKKRKVIQTLDETDLDLNETMASSAIASNTSCTDTNCNTAKEGGEINQNINKAIPITKIPTKATYDTDKEEKSKNGENSSNTRELKKRGMSFKPWMK
eukprot:6463491-Ditylum_brightwellii.AAC.1